jgi:hypothetical protein
MPAKKPDGMVLQELQRAIEANAPARLKALIEGGVSVNQKIGEFPRRTLLEFAVEKNAVEVVEFLIAAGANLDTGLHKPVILATEWNRTEILGILLEAGANPDATIATPDEDLFDETALMIAVESPDTIPLVELLLKHKANLNLATNQGLTALDYAVDAENIEAVRRLLEAGCKPAGPILHGPLFGGTKAGLELVKILIAAGADLYAIGNRPVHLEGRAPLEGVLQQLKEKGGLIRMLERRPREDWEEETLRRWKSEASIYQEMVEELIRARESLRESSAYAS